MHMTNIRLAPTAGSGTVLEQYGRAMLSLQLLERMLALCVLALEAEPECPVSNSRRWAIKLVRKMVHAARKASAREMRKRLDGHGINHRLLAEIDIAIKWRDALAHRYLSDAFDSEKQAFRTGADAELAQLITAFDSLTKRLRSETEQLLQLSPRDISFDGIVEVWIHIARAAALDRPVHTADGWVNL
jgi:hypothetical protein